MDIISTAWYNCVCGGWALCLWVVHPPFPSCPSALLPACVHAGSSAGQHWQQLSCAAAFNKRAKHYMFWIGFYADATVLLNDYTALKYCSMGVHRKDVYNSTFVPITQLYLEMTQQPEHTRVRNHSFLDWGNMLFKNLAQPYLATEPHLGLYIRTQTGMRGAHSIIWYLTAQRST